MATDISDAQVQPSSATVRETAMVLDSIGQASGRRLAGRGSVKNSHACDVAHALSEQIVEREPDDTALILKPISCNSKTVAEPRVSITRDLSSQIDLFYQVIAIYQKSSKGRHLPPDFDIKKAHNWDEVHQAARLAEAKCKRDGTGSVFSRIGRAIQRSAPAVEPWLGLIPDGDYTSVLCGGLKIAFGVAEYIHAQRVQIFETFRQIPETIRLAEDRLEEWPEDETLHDAAIELYLAVLDSIQAMIVWLVDTSTRKRIWQLLKKPKMEEPNDIGLDVIQKEVKRLQGRATALQSQAIVRTDANVEKTGSVVDIINISTQSIKRIMIEELRPTMNETRNLVRETRWKVDAYAIAPRSDIQTNGIATLEPETYEDPLDSSYTLRKGTKCEDFDMGKFKEEVVRPMFKLLMQIIDIKTEHWRDLNYRETVRAYVNSEVFKILLAYSERPAYAVFNFDVWMSPKTNAMKMKLTYLGVEEPEGGDAFHDSLANLIPKSKRQNFIKSKL